MPPYVFWWFTNEPVKHYDKLQVLKDSSTIYPYIRYFKELFLKYKFFYNTFKLISELSFKTKTSNASSSIRKM